MESTTLPRSLRRPRPAALVAVLGLLSAQAGAQTGLTFGPTLSDGLRAPARWAWSASADTPLPSPTYALQARDRLALTGWALAPGGSALGLSLSLSTPRTAGLQALGVAGAGGGSADIGLRWQTQWDPGTRLDLSAWRRLPQAGAFSAGRAAGGTDDSGRTLYGSSVELQFRSLPGLGFSPEPRVIGLRIEGGQTGLRDAGPVLYYRTRF